MTDRRFSVPIAALGFVLWLVVPELDPGVLRARLWAFDHLQDTPLWLRAVAALIPLLLVSERIRRGVICGALRAATLAGRSTRLRWPRRGLAAALLLWLLWALRQRNYEIGDSALLIQLLTRYVHLNGFHVTYDEPVELYVHSIAYRWLHRLFDWPVEDAYAAVSVLAGLGFAVVLLALWRRSTPDPVLRWSGIALCVSTAGVQLFFGYVENYTLVALGLLTYVMLARAYLDGRCGILAPSIALGSSFCLHVLAGWLFPSLLLLWFERRRARELLPAALGLILPAAATVGYLAAIGYPPSAMGQTHLASLKFVFFTTPGTPQFQFAPFGVEHWIAQMNELLLVGLPGLLVLAGVMLWLRRLPDFGDPFLRFLLLCTVLFQVFASTWNPELGAYADWDLFAVAGIFWTLLGAWVLVRTCSPAEASRIALPVVALCLCLTASWVGSNATREFPVDAMHGDAHLRLARRHFQAGELDAANRQFEECLRVDPRNGSALVGLASVHWTRNEHESARGLLRRYLELHPHGPHAATAQSALNRY